MRPVRSSLLDSHCRALCRARRVGGAPRQTAGEGRRGGTLAGSRADRGNREVAGLPASIASKVLYKKRPALIPILDNQAIFGAYMNPAWPERRSLMESVYAVSRIGEAIDWIAFDITRRANERTWAQLADLEPLRSRIDLFDVVWWMYFRMIAPVRPPMPVPAPPAARADSRWEGSAAKPDSVTSG